MADMMKAIEDGLDEQEAWDKVELHVDFDNKPERLIKFSVYHVE